MYSLITALLHFFPPETAHQLVITLLRLFPVKNSITDIDLRVLSQELLGLHFPHPLGLAAGFDKDAEVFHRLGQLGFSFVEIGTVTPEPQPGNPKPRLFRLKEQQAIINRYGFNSKGMDYVAKQLHQHPHRCITGVNIGKNKNTVDPVSDFLRGAEVLVDQADYLTINVSSPNTPGLRDLQTPEALEPIIDGIHAIVREKQRRVPLFVKISPDMTLEQETSLVEFLLEVAVDGIIVSNTTLGREGVASREVGGLSGPPLRSRSTSMLRRIYQMTQGSLVLIGCGGISSGQDAYEKLRAGADLLQLYTAFIYQGPAVLHRVLSELTLLLARDGVKSIREIRQ